MSWYNAVSSLEIFFLLLFVGLYALYLFRLRKISKRLKSSLGGVIGKVVLRTTYFLLLIVALLGPSFGENKREIQSVGKDIFIAVDLSQSMNAHDIQPTRLEKVKFELKNIVEAFSSDRIGLIIFSSEAFIQCPLTFDQNALNLFIETLHSGLVPNTGTDFGPPMEVALKKLITEEEGDNKSKIIVLISDGEDFGEDTEEISSEVQDNDIKVFTLGVGSERGSRIKTSRGFKKDQNGADVVTKLNAESLRKLASTTDGKYYEISDSKNDIERLINNISAIEGEVREARQVDVSANKYFYFLGAALLLILLDVLINVRTVRL
jgi:Ca-activated chloride channel family protein